MSILQEMELTAKEMEVRPNTIAEVQVDASFRKITKNAICFHIWKIDDDRLEAVSRPRYGTFYDDCAYIIYAAGPIGIHVNQETITREANKVYNGNLERFIHFWLGVKVSEQKRSNVAHKIQELDSYFGNVATEYREMQNFESARFISYFKRGMIIRCGALANSINPNRLFQLRGRKWMRCTEMENISWTHFGSDFVMVLRTDPHVFVWLGRSSSTGEHRDAIEMAHKFQSNIDEFTIVDDGYEQLMPLKRKILWNSFLPLKERIVSQTMSTGERQQYNKLKIYKCGYKGTRLHLDQLDVGIPTKQDLNDSETVFVLDGSTQGIWLWIGSRTELKDNISAMGNGRAFVKKKKYPNSTPIARVVEGHEPIEFIRLFPNWPSEWHESNTIYKSVKGMLCKYDSLLLCQRPKMAAETQLVDTGNGERKIYRVTKDEVLEMMPRKVVIFATSNCYALQYTVKVDSANPTDVLNVGVQTIVYQWNGASACADTVAKCERFASALFESQHKKAMYVQMYEYDETPHFLQIFDGSLIILQDERNMQQINNMSNNNNSTNGNITKSTNFVLKIYGDASYNSRAVEIYPFSSLNSKECYVVKTTHIWVWCGHQSTGDAREVAKKIGALLGESCLVLEGNEPQDFWKSMTQPNTNGKASTSSTNSIGNQSNGSISPQPGTLINGGGGNPKKSRILAQLFLVWFQHGKFFSQEILGYDQSDLSPEYVYVLDVGMICYIWLGEFAAKHEQSKYLKLAQNYLDTVPIARGSSTAFAVVRQHDEPNTFKGLFEQWNHNIWNNYVTYQQKRQSYSTNSDPTDENGTSSINGDNGSSPLPPVVMNYKKDFDRHNKYPIALLQQEIAMLPTEVNPLKREMHLTHDDFVALFNMTYWEFDDLPAWKKQELKKKYKLF